MENEEIKNEKFNNTENSEKNRIVSTDIQMTNGVVHALSYNFDLTSLISSIY